MLFNSTQYIVFLIFVVAAYWAMARMHVLRIVFLLLMSYYFYMSWNTLLIILIVFSTVIDYFCGKIIYSARSKRKKKLFLFISLIANLGLLAYFKYTNFFIDSYNSITTTPWLTRIIPILLGLFTAYAVTSLFLKAGKKADTEYTKRLWISGAVLFNAALIVLYITKNLFFKEGAYLPALHIILPVGISFYTFQSMSYTLDIYNGSLKPTKSFIKFSLFVSFFPQLVAGPIVRAREFLWQLENEPVFDAKAASAGLFLILIGMIKKILIADYLAVNIVDRVFDNPKLFSPLESLFGVYGYAMQIYCDFSGYSDMAIGSALLLGFKLPKNFDVPYVASNLQSFWHRWHISLSTWLRDYLYIPLGGSKKGAAATYVNIFITFLLGGLWHGAGWTFVVWGLMHGIGLAVTRMVQRIMKNKKLAWLNIHDKPHGWLYWIGVFVTFHYVCLSWLFFRGTDFENAIQVLTQITQLFHINPGSGFFKHITHLISAAPNIFDLSKPLLQQPLILPILAFAFAVHFTPRKWINSLSDYFVALPAYGKALVLLAVAILLYHIAAATPHPFIYFQF